ncbi:hypothetical protein [Clostridium sp.]|uniref:hypothetical protein n=1 Tax=Clostridium sp. TaxID=1506 RepID=UPI0025BBD769|nr:hypothetical protein [Clostridium sp.]
MKRFLGLLLCGVLTLACLVVYGEGKVVKGVNEEIDNYVQNTLNNFTEEGYDASADILGKIYKDSTIRYKDIKIENNIATVIVEVKNKNFSTIINRGSDLAKSRINLVTPSKTLMNNAMWEVYDKEEPEKREVELELFRVGDEWKLEAYSYDELVYLVTGIRD